MSTALFHILILESNISYHREPGAAASSVSQSFPSQKNIKRNNDIFSGKKKLYERKTPKMIEMVLPLKGLDHSNTLLFMTL